MREHPVDLQLKKLIQGSIAPADLALRRDLWPELSARLGERPKKKIALPRLKWWEWVLAAGDVGGAFYAPDAIPALLYHL
jgi:hypothetical protein